MDAKDPNAHVREYLEYYTKLDKPGFAVLLTGDWGAGKTWFINDFIRRQGEKEKSKAFVNISAYGAGSVEDLGERIFAKLNPLLGSKAAVVGGKVLKGLFKIAFKVDYEDVIGDKDVTLEGRPSMPEEAVTRNGSLHGKILVMDDLERATLPWMELMGFVNHVIEREHGHVILIAYESEIKKNSSDYSRTKEKNIGMTLGIEPDLESALDYLIDEHPFIRQRVPNHREVITEIVEMSACKSLRVLRFALRDFARICGKIPDGLEVTDEKLVSLMQTTLALSIEIYVDSITAEELYSFRHIGDIELAEAAARSYGRSASDYTDEQKARFRQLGDISKKYYFLELGYLRPSSKWWKNFYHQGIIETDGLVSHLKFQPTQHPWEQLMNREWLTDAEYNNLLQQTWDELAHGPHHSFSQILHVALAHLRAIEDKLWIASVTSNRAEDVVQRACQALDSVQKIPYSDDSDDGWSAWPTDEQVNYDRIRAHAQQLVDEAYRASIHQRVATIVPALQQGHDAFQKILLEIRANPGVLAQVNLGHFASALHERTPVEQVRALSAVARQIDHVMRNPKHRNDLSDFHWFEQLRGEIDSWPSGIRRTTLLPKMSHYIESIAHHYGIRPVHAGPGHSQDTPSAASSPPSQIDWDEDS